MMRLFSIPIQRWPLGHHVLAAIAVILAVAVLGAAVLKTTEAAVRQKSAELMDLQSELARKRAAAAITETPKTDFRASLPLASRIDDVSRDLLQYAEQRGVSLTSVAQQPGSFGAQEFKTLQFSVNAVAPYPAFKMWLADLLGRYPTLAVQQMSVRTNASDGNRQDFSLSLLFAYKG